MERSFACGCVNHQGRVSVPGSLQLTKPCFSGGAQPKLQGRTCLVWIRAASLNQLCHLLALLSWAESHLGLMRGLPKESFWLISE